MGYELADLELSPAGRTIRVFIDTLPENPAPVTVDDCETVTRHLQRLFTVENIDYDRLEVSSPGLDRPLKKLADYTRFSGEEASFKLRSPLSDGAKKMKARILGVEGEAVRVERDGGAELAIEFSQIERARLVPRIEWRKAK